jgi:hypothetical protein
MKTTVALVVIALGATTVHADRRASDKPETETIVVTEKGSPFWAGVAVTSGVVTLGLFGAGMYYQASWKGQVDSIQAEKPEPGAITGDDCGRADIDDKNGVFASVCRDRDRAKSLLLAGLIAVPVVVVSTYVGFIRETKREVRTVAIIPTVTTETAGLTLDVRW